MIVKAWPARGVLSQAAEGRGRADAHSPVRIPPSGSECIYLFFFTSPQKLLTMGMRFEWGLGFSS